jgi:predicted alpha/beta-hydrolase family hydrolase
MSVSTLLDLPPDPRACLVLAHGAGAGMRHAFLANVASELRALGIATLRYNFPYMDRGSKRTDPPVVCHETVRAAVAEAERLVPNVPLFAGGKSFGGRMTSQAQALTLLEPLFCRLGARATLKLFEHADHSFHVPVRSGRTDAQVRGEMLQTFADWSRRIVD